MEFHSSDGYTLFYNPTTKEVWYGDPSGGVDSNMSVNANQPCEAPGGNTPELRDSSTDDFGDDDIDAAIHLVSTVSPILPSHVLGMSLGLGSDRCL